MSASSRRHGGLTGGGHLLFLVRLGCHLRFQLRLRPHPILDLIQGAAKGLSVFGRRVGDFREQIHGFTELLPELFGRDFTVERDPPVVLLFTVPLPFFGLTPELVRLVLPDPGRTCELRVLRSVV